MSVILRLVSLTLIVFAASAAGHAFQRQRGGRDEGTKSEAPKPAATPAAATTKRGGKPRPAATPAARATPRETPRPKNPHTAELTIVAVPADSTVLVNGDPFQSGSGVVRLSNLPAGNYHVVVSREGRRTEEYRIGLGAGERREPFRVELEEAAGTLTVVPNAADTTITLFHAETSHEIGRYGGSVSNLELAPGRYRVAVSKAGHRTTVRDFSVGPAERVRLEPAVEAERAAEAAGRPRREPPRFRPDAQMSLRADPDGKHVIVTLAGRSGQTAAPFGTLDVTLAFDGRQVAGQSVEGMLTGYPCQFDIVRMANVAEVSFVESPGTGNEWARAVVRLKPKDSKRVMRFQINWKLLQSAGTP